MSEPSQEFLAKATYLVDASSYVFRAYYAIQRPLQAPDGTPTHATFGFMQMIQSLVELHGISHCVLIWDRPGKGFRHEIFEEYKANRTAPPEDLSVQIENARKFADLLGLPQLDAPGFEADDVLATIVAQHDDPFVIVTADKDLLQLVGPNVWCLDTMKQKWSNVAETEEKFGVEPARVPQVQALSGDSVDNVPGIPGVGPKTAIELIRTFGTLDQVLETARERFAQDPKKAYPDKLKGKCLESVATNAEDARVSLRLVSLRRDAPVPPDVDALGLRAPKLAELREFAKNLGFSKSVDKLLATFKMPAETKAPTSAVGSAKENSRDPEDADESERPSSAKPTEGERLKFETKLLRSASELEEWLRKNRSQRTLALDTETFGLEAFRGPNLVGMSLAFTGDEGVYVPFRHSALYGPQAEVVETLQVLGKELEKRAAEDDFRVVFQNAKFDLHAFADDGFRFPENLRIDDTMVASFVLDPAASHGLDAMSIKHFGYAPMSFKEVTGEAGDFSQVPLDKACFYAAEDAVVTRLLWDKLAPELKSEKVWSVYDGIDRPTIPILAEMERHGVMLAEGPLAELSQSFHADLKRITHEAFESLRKEGLEVAEDLNLNSPKQLSVILYEKLGLPVLKKTKTGPSTDVSVLEELASMHPFPEYILEVRELSKLLSTYIDSLPKLVNPKTGRIHTDFSQTVAATGRLSSSNPNLQNIPIKTERGKAIRRAFRAPPGHKLVGVDYSQIELRLLAHISGDPELTKAFNEDADIHRRTAALVLGKKESEVTSEDRRIAKAINYGIAYGQTAFGLSKALRIPRNVAQTFIDGYFKTYVGIRTYMDEAVQEARDKGCVRTATGRRRLLPEIHSRNQNLRQFGERMAINSPIQGLAADLMKVGMMRVRDRLREEMPDASLVLQVHDELLFEVPAAQAKELEALVVETLEDRRLLEDFGVGEFKVLMKAEAAVGDDWGDIS